MRSLSSDQRLWFTLADCLASKILAGKLPKIVKALRFSPGEPQDDLKPISIAGNDAYKIDPLCGDLYKCLIDLRSAVKARMKDAYGAEKKALDAEQQPLKIIANATSYGIFVELIVEEVDKKETRLCFGSGNDDFPVEVDKAETPGRYFHPLLATLITGAARLMLAITERLLVDAGLDWAFCDTDSMAIAKPEGMGQETFFARAKSVAEWFTPLNPYEVKGPLLKIEDVNYAIGSKKLAPLCCLAISSKRYVVFNLDEQGQPVIRKASAHGLGHLMAPYDPAEAPPNIPAPAVPPSEIGVERWQYDLWFQIVRATLDSHPEQVDLTYHPALQLPAMSRYAVTTQHWNDGLRNTTQPGLTRIGLSRSTSCAAFRHRRSLEQATRYSSSAMVQNRREKGNSIHFDRSRRILGRARKLPLTPSTAKRETQFLPIS